MPRDDEDDLFNEEFDLVDDDFDDDFDENSADNESDEELDEQPRDDAADESDDAPAATRGSGRGKRRSTANGAPAESDEGVAVEEEIDDGLDEYGRPKPEPNYLVHIYQYQKFNRTLDRPFTPEDAEAFASEYNRTGKVYGRMAVAGKNDAKPKKSLD